MEVERQILTVFPHPDDEAYSVAGLMALHRAKGVPVTVVCGTSGEMGRNLGNPPVSREGLRELRRNELRAACREVGVDDVRFLGVWDKTVEFVDPEWLAGRVRKVLEEVRPSLVVTFHPVLGGHPDHCAMGAATVRAVAQWPAGERPKVWHPVMPDLEDKLDWAVEKVDIRSVGEKKLAALKAHNSQTVGWREKPIEDEKTKARFERMRSEERFWVRPAD